MNRSLSSGHTLVAALSNCDTLSAQTAARRRTVFASHRCSNVLGSECAASLAQLYSVRWLGGLASHHQHCKRYHHTTENSPRDAFQREHAPFTRCTALGQEPPRCMSCCESLPAHVSSRASFRTLPVRVQLRHRESTESHLDSSSSVRLGAHGQVCCCAFALSRRWRRCVLPWAHFLGLVPQSTCR